MTQEICPSREELLKEYELCQTHAQSLESTIWQTGTAMSIGGIGPLIVMANHPMSEQPPCLVAAAVGIGVFLMSSVWVRLARRWWSIQQACFMRMRHIETELGLFQTRYVHYLDDPPRYVQYLDDPLTLTDSGLRKEYESEILERAEKRERLCRVHQRAGIQRFSCCLPTIIFISWAVYLGALRHAANLT